MAKIDELEQAVAQATVAAQQARAAYDKRGDDDARIGYAVEQVRAIHDVLAPMLPVEQPQPAPAPAPEANPIDGPA